MNTIKNLSIFCSILSTRTKLSLNKKTLLSLLPLHLGALAGDKFLTQKKFPAKEEKDAKEEKKS
jgi:hypothetical protein